MSIPQVSIYGLSLRIVPQPPPPPQQDIQLRLRSLPPPPGLASYPIRIQESFLIPQLSQLLVLLSKCVDIVEMSTVTGDPHNGPFIAGQLGILADLIDDARRVLKGGEAIVGGRWWEDHLQSTVCMSGSPPTFRTKIGLQVPQTVNEMILTFRVLSIARSSSQLVCPLLHHRCGAGSNPTHSHTCTGGTPIFVHHRIHLPPTGTIAGTTTAR